MDNRNSKVVYKVGNSFAGTLTIVFIVLKLTNTIRWSWLWVLSPLWISLVIDLVLVVILFVLIALFRDR